MNCGKAIPVWYSEEDRRRLEEASALAGYRHMSKYIRDKSLGYDSQRTSAQDSVEAWAERQELAGRLAEIERTQRSAQTLLAMQLFLLRSKATTAETNALILACESARTPTDLVAATSSQLAALIPRFAEDS